MSVLKAVMDNTGDNLMHEYHNYSSFNPKGPGPRARDGVLVPWSPRPRSAWQLRKKSGAAVMCKTFCFSHKSFVVSLLYLFIDFLDFWTDFFLLSPSRFFVDYFCFRRFFSSVFLPEVRSCLFFRMFDTGDVGETRTRHTYRPLLRNHTSAGPGSRVSVAHGRTPPRSGSGAARSLIVRTAQPQAGLGRAGCAARPRGVRAAARVELLRGPYVRVRGRPAHGARDVVPARVEVAQVAQVVAHAARAARRVDVAPGSGSALRGQGSGVRVG